MRYIVFLFLIFSSVLKAQDAPSIFEPGVISTNGVFGFSLSPDAKHSVWVNSNGGRDTLIIMESFKINDQWQTPKPASFSGKPGVWKDIDPVFSPDGNMILFQSNRPVEGKPNRTGFDIWAVRKINSVWGDAFHLGNTINSDASESYASMSNKGNIYFMKENENGVGQSDLYVSKLINGTYQAPENLGSPINTKERESNPYISPKEDYLIFFSTDSSGYGEVDLYISFNKNGEWTKAKNLGIPINSSESEFCPFIHQKQKRIYFSRLKKNGTRFIENIYSYPFNVKTKG